MPYPLKKLRKILASYGVSEDESRGKGSHTLFYKRFPEGEFSYPVPTDDKDVLDCYVKGCRKKFRLTKADGISDSEFFGRA